jgi:hypothetical protein
MSDKSLAVSPQQLTIELKMANAFLKYDQYIDGLAEGKLDGYMDSSTPVDYVPPLASFLLLDRLGQHCDRERIGELFDPGTTVFVAMVSFYLVVYLNFPRRHLFAPSGAGRTHLTLDGLCSHWGFYISCKGNEASLSGSSAFDKATSRMMIAMSTWNKGTGNSLYENNYASACRVFFMLLCVRVFVMKKLLDWCTLE